MSSPKRPESVREMHERKKAEAAAELANAEREAHASGKEPFDLARFEQLYGHGSQAHREQQWREIYYVHREHRTLADLVRELQANEPWEDSR
jgi:hypothetical protein